MSFILDALRKVEDEKRSGPGSQSIEPGIGGAGGPGRRRQTLFMGAVALASAVVTAVALTLFTLGSEPGTKDSDGLNEISSEPAAAAEGNDELMLLPPLAEPEPPTQPEPETIVPETIVEVPASAPAALGEPPFAEPPPELEPAAPIRVVGRVVGRERTARVDFATTLDADEVEDPPDPETEAVESDGTIPSLVLQGTSVVDGNPVAVISDQRVFEGDLIEGARVLRIGEREVELELEGKRFVLRL